MRKSNKSNQFYPTSKSPDFDRLPSIVTPKTQISQTNDSSIRHKTDITNTLLSNQPRHMRKWVSMQKISSVKSLQSVDIYDISVQIIDEVINMDTDKLILDPYFKHLDNLLNILKSLDCKDLIIKLMLIKTEMFKRRGDLYEANHTLRQVKNITEQFHTPQVLKVYRLGGDLMIMLKLYHKARHNYLKLLYFAWSFNNTQKELDAYEKIALCYFYEGRIQDSAILHQRSMIGKLEPQDSKIREYGIQRAQYHFRNHAVVQQLNELGQLQDSSSDEEDSTIQIVISVEKATTQASGQGQTQSTQPSQPQRETQTQFPKVTSPNRLITHCSNNRAKQNHQLLGYHDIIKKSVSKNQGFNFFSNDFQLRYYRRQLNKIKQILQCWKQET